VTARRHEGDAGEGYAAADRHDEGKQPLSSASHSLTVLTSSADAITADGTRGRGDCARVGRADARIRTADPFITSEVLYQLSYVGEAGSV
jgi:hypothetical protein